MTVASGQSKQRGLARVAFLARIDAIKAELSAGWTKIAVYEKYKDSLRITYSHFTRYVAKYIVVDAAHPLAKTMVEPPQVADSLGQSESAHSVHNGAARPMGQPRFEFDSQPPNKDELI